MLNLMLDTFLSIYIIIIGLNNLRWYIQYTIFEINIYFPLLLIIGPLCLFNFNLQIILTINILHFFQTLIFGLNFNKEISTTLLSLF
jgi:hypothetical protein